MLVAYILVATCITILLGFPIAGALGLIAGVIMIATSGTDLLLIFIQRTYAATTSFPLLAIPFFILAGNLMNVGGTTERIFEVAKLLVGRVRGGLAYVNVIGSMIFAGMSGSAVADAAAFALCRENKLPIVVFDLMKNGNIGRAVRGEVIGTLVA